jgi:hypothetical protein
MLLTLVPIIREGKIAEASTVLELAAIRSTDDFVLAYRALTEAPRALPGVETSKMPPQIPYLPRLDAYSALIPPQQICGFAGGPGIRGES